MKARETKTKKNYLRRGLTYLMTMGMLFSFVTNGLAQARRATDIALVGGAGHPLPVALSKRDGRFAIIDQVVPGGFGTLAAIPQAVRLAGDFDGDGRTDIALTGVSWWNTIPIAFSRGDYKENTFHFDETNEPAGEFATLASDNRWIKLVGDFNGDGMSDIALAGLPGATTVPIAFSHGNGTFVIKNQPVPDFPAWAATAGTAKMVADFDNDGNADIALAGPLGWDTMPVAYSRGDGNFDVKNHYIPDFSVWAPGFSAHKLVGDFDGNGSADVSLTGKSGWTTIHQAFSSNCLPARPACTPRTFTSRNPEVGLFASWSADPRAFQLVGDYDGDGKSDILLTGPSEWLSLPVAFSRANGFEIHNENVGTFASWASDSRTSKLIGDFNADGKSDFALIGPSEWLSIPVAFSNGDGSFTVTNYNVDGGFSGMALDATRYKGHFDLR